MTRPRFPPAPPGALRRNLIRFGVAAVAVVLLQRLLSWANAFGQHVDTDFGMPIIMVAALVVYALLVAVPFMPGVEIGISLLLMKGAEAAPFVWLATCIGLTLAFLAGRYMPYPWLCSILSDLRLGRAADFLDRIQALPAEARLGALTQRLPGRLGTAIARFRYIALAVLFNLPGNSVIGGGGGIAMVAGLSRVFGTWSTLFTIMLAVAPVPLLVMLVGPEVLPWTN
ncbi:hypothetical protein [Primorskyibacter sedentarius]|uniref:hypothetical protein n=1 Tax=Primorskyibacter sedentarius TaxID=745311 RepID=UPI003EBB7E94